MILIYFDNAATSGKKPQSVVDAVANALKKFSANPGRSGHELSIKTADAVFKTREKIANFFGAIEPEKVVFTLNCTHSINCVLKGVLKRGDHLIISNLEHNAVMRPLKKLKANFSVAEVGKNKSETLANFERLIKPNTRLIFVTGASNVTGQILPIKELGDLCKNKGILFGVDGAQIAGNRPINMQKMNIDFLCIAPHKSLYAPMGIGILICRKPLENTILEGGTGTDSLDFSQPRILPEGMESGTINVPAIFGVSAGLDFVEKIGIERAYKHEFELLEMLYFGLSKNPYVTLYTAPPRFLESVPVLPFNYKDYDSFKTAAILNKNGFAVRGGFHCAPTAHKALKTGDFGAVRVSFGLFNTKNEVQSLLNLINSNNFS